MKFVIKYFVVLFLTLLASQEVYSQECRVSLEEAAIHIQEGLYVQAKEELLERIHCSDKTDKDYDLLAVLMYNLEGRKANDSILFFQMEAYRLKPKSPYLENIASFYCELEDFENGLFFVLDEVLKHPEFIEDKMVNNNLRLLLIGCTNYDHVIDKITEFSLKMNDRKLFQYFIDWHIAIAFKRSKGKEFIEKHINKYPDKTYYYYIWATTFDDPYNPSVEFDSMMYKGVLATHSDTLFALIRTSLDSQEKAEELIKVYSEYIKYDSTKEDYYKDRAKLSRYIGDDESAVSDYIRLIDRGYSIEEDNILYIAKYYFDNREFLNSLEMLSRMNSLTFDAKKIKASCLLYLGEFEKSEVLFREWVNKENETPFAFLGLAIVELSRQEYAKSNEALSGVDDGYSEIKNLLFEVNNVMLETNSSIRCEKFRELIKVHDKIKVEKLKKKTGVSKVIVIPDDSWSFKLKIIVNNCF